MDTDFAIRLENPSNRMDIGFVIVIEENTSYKTYKDFAIGLEKLSVLQDVHRFVL